MSEELVILSQVLDSLEKIDVTCQQKEIVANINSAAGLLSSIPMQCRLEACPYSSGCQLYTEGLVNLGERCPIETDLIRTMFISYCRQMDVNPDFDKVEAGLIKDLCSVEIQALRANKLMSFGDFIVDIVDSIDPVSGQVYYKKDLHVAVSWSERLLSQKLRILDSLVASPLAIAKFRGGTGEKTLQDRIVELKKRVDVLASPDDSANEVFEIESYSVGDD